MKKNNNVKKLKLSKETLGVLDNQNLAGLVGAAPAPPPKCPVESAMICSVQHTCVSCYPSHTCA